jgi:hypothetical protein
VIKLKATAFLTLDFKLKAIKYYSIQTSIKEQFSILELIEETED